MARLIDADALVENIKSEIDDDKEIYPDDKTSIMFRAGMKTVIRIVKNQDTVDPVKHGRWEESKCLDDCFWVCSCCKFPSQAVAAPKLYKYCPNCGARMDGDGK